MLQRDIQLGEWRLFLFVAALGSAARLAYDLNRGQHPNLKDVFRAFYLGGICALLCGLLTYDYLGSKPYLWLFMCGVAGLGSADLLNLGAALIVKLFKKRLDAVTGEASGVDNEQARKQTGD